MVRFEESILSGLSIEVAVERVLGFEPTHQSNLTPREAHKISEGPELAHLIPPA